MVLSDLDQVIKIIEDGIKEDDDLIKKIRFPKFLLRTLHKLNSTIGQPKIKNDIAVQVLYLIEKMNNPKNIQRPLLNMVLYGPPGVGKTKYGTIIATILYALGYIKKRPKTASSFYEDYAGYCNPSYLVGLIAVGSFAWAMVYPFVFGSSSFSWIYFIIGFIIIIAVAILVYYLFFYTPTPSDICSDEEGEEDTVPQDDIIKIVSREHFVDKWQGHSDKKTSELLKANRGKVIFIDEAYSLYEGEHDMYGGEVLNVINRELSEHPDETIIIFAGYENKLKSTIFKVQPGLLSRCPTRFECKRYNSDELFAIFKLQLKQTGATIEGTEQQFKSLFKSNYHLLKDQGRDCENLLNFSQMEKTRTLLYNPKRYNPNRITLDNVKLGFDQLASNMINSDDNHVDQIKDMLTKLDDKQLREVMSMLHRPT
jgi:DNA polymerase III delta prime subunit